MAGDDAEKTRYCGCCGHLVSPDIPKSGNCGERDHELHRSYGKKFCPDCGANLYPEKNTIYKNY